MQNHYFDILSISRFKKIFKFVIETLRAIQYREKSYLNFYFLKNNRVKYFVIRRRPPGAGLFSNVNHVLQGCLRAEALERVPVVDMQNYQNWYSRNYSLCNTKNTWEFFFRPLSPLPLEKIYKTQDVVLSKGERLFDSHWLCDKRFFWIDNAEKIMSVQSTITKNLRLQPWCEEVLRETKDYLNWENTQNKIGLSVRTEFRTLKPSFHPRQPTNQMLFSKIEELISQNNWGKISLFVASEDSQLKNTLEKRFRNLIMPDFREISSFTKLLKKYVPNYDSNDIEIMKTYGYLIETFLLSDTNSAIIGVSNGSALAALLNGGAWIKPYFFRMGVY